MNQSQIENLSTEEYSYFLAYGSLPKQEEVPTMFELIHSILGDEKGDGDDERALSQGFEDVCSFEGHDSFGSDLQDDACTYTQRSTCE